MVIVETLTDRHLVHVFHNNGDTNWHYRCHNALKNMNELSRFDHKPLVLVHALRRSLLISYPPWSPPTPRLCSIQSVS